MFQVAITGERIGSDAEEGNFSESGWIDPQWSMTVLHSEREDVRVAEFETLGEAVEYIEETIGYVDDGSNGETFYAADTFLDFSTGDSWSYAGHITEV